jgi:hypothetical protein
VNNKGGVAHSLQDREFAKKLYNTKSGDQVVMMPAGRVKVIKGTAGNSVFIDGKKINSTADALAQKFGFENYTDMIKQPEFSALAQNKDMFIHKVVSMTDVMTEIEASLPSVTTTAAQTPDALATEYLNRLVDNSQTETIEEFLHDKFCKK